MSPKSHEAFLPDPADRLPGLRDVVHAPADEIHWVVGPPGAGKTTALSTMFKASNTLFWEVPPLEGPALQGDLDRLIDAVLGPIAPLRAPPDPLTFRRDDAWWMQRFQEVFQALATQRPGSSWVVDGIDALRLAGRSVPELLIRAWALEGRPTVSLVVTGEGLPDFVVASGEGTHHVTRPGGPPVQVRLHRLDPQLPYRMAAKGLGPRDARDALTRWSLFGGSPVFLPRRPESVEGSAQEVVIRRVLDPAGDLHDAPIAALRGRVQAPARYLGILFALARGERQWGDMARLAGVQSGNQLAPYLRKLEAEGWIRVVNPLDGRAGGRRRRYEITDPFLEFWMAYIFPWRSLLRHAEPSRFHAERIQPFLPSIVNRGLARVALAYMEHHARETLPASARVVGSLWAEGVEIPVAARLANGQVCYGWIGSIEHRLDERLFLALAEAMDTVRWGMGRESRAPIFFLPGPAEEGLRRQVARNPLARILTPERLFASETDID